MNFQISALGSGKAAATQQQAGRADRDHEISERRDLFGRQFRQLRRTRRLYTALGLILFVVLCIGSSIVGRFSPTALLEGAPKLGEYIWKILPTLRWATLPADLAHWFYALPKWLDLLLETVLMAYLATLLGSLASLAACFFAARNLAPNTWSYFSARRIGEFFRTIPIWCLR